MPWKEGFTSGIILTIVITILSPLSQYIVYTFISPQYFENIIAYSVDNNRMTREQAEAYFSLRSLFDPGNIWSAGNGSGNCSSGGVVCKDEESGIVVRVVGCRL
jgi:hypothetical protein